MSQNMVRHKPFGSDYGLVHEAIVTGRKVGAGEEFWTALTDETLFRKAMDAVLGEHRSYPVSASQEQARAIMGSNFYHLSDAARHLGVTYSEEQQVELAEIPYSVATLEACRDTHILFPGYPLNILNLRKRVRTAFRKQDWYNQEDFARKAKVGLRWYLIRKTPVPNTTNKNLADQQKELAGNESVPRACEVIYMIMLHFLATGERLFEGVYVRCSDVSSSGDRVCLGGFDAEGLDVHCWCVDPYDDVGLAGARNFDPQPLNPPAAELTLSTP